MLIKTAYSHTFTLLALHPHPRARQTERAGDVERRRERRQKEDNLIGNMPLYFVSSDFEMRLEGTQVNEEK